ncbi:molecular chaperone TorD family protein [Cuneatibacter sp. NSJ-177]|jgi:TorA maturation chaperone TorD|uniref:TorD/DmsD family molecular chaperone n=1 Tax=Cuneatibacter sp. NSJ-177 TaxID=2931401 RepID=UPI001FD40FBA|nr:molecular chaperone TorD family protein [Cuneatibacter sp. NSJ-177]MCJ7836643.1 molecular chaperone TorD family protein [Cuneatibacter sp. NSJ-177]
MDQKLTASYLRVLAHGVKQEISPAVLGRWMETDLFREIPYGEDVLETCNGREQMASFRAAYRSGQVTGEDLDGDYLKLFIGAGHPLAPPWGSYYLNEKHLLFQDETAAVREIMQRYGFAGEKKGVPEDFLSYELEFLAERLESGEKAAEAGRDFLQQWVLSWVPGWNQLVQIYGDTDFYPALANLITGACRCLARDWEDEGC